MLTQRSSVCSLPWKSAHFRRTRSHCVMLSLFEMDSVVIFSSREPPSVSRNFRPWCKLEITVCFRVLWNRNAIHLSILLESNVLWEIFFSKSYVFSNLWSWFLCFPTFVPRRRKSSCVWLNGVVVISCIVCSICRLNLYLWSFCTPIFSVYGISSSRILSPPL